ncbi:hypothetical protein MA16_Dca021046 [Dendrobium catenatum]|uniref:Uncharacterized protein n=1 Tax=Dendrobium catenatum TaxID=906689 RepID=A0A2I0W1Z6_9ASPA|nr:hypothetical protein MA16_Dca021046 [Dendrobium catenatum]
MIVFGAQNNQIKSNPVDVGLSKKITLLTIRIITISIHSHTLIVRAKRRNLHNFNDATIEESKIKGLGEEFTILKLLDLSPTFSRIRSPIVRGCALK